MLNLWMRRIFSALLRIEEILLSTSVLGLAALTILNVLSRSLLNQSLAFAQELSQFLIIVVCFVGLSYATSQGRHIRMTAIYDQFSARGRKRLMVLIASSTALLLFVLGIYSVRYVMTVYQLGGISPALRVPYYLVYLVCPVGLFLSAFQYLLVVVRNLTSPGVYIAFDKLDKYDEPVSRES